MDLTKFNENKMINYIKKMTIQMSFGFMSFITLKRDFWFITLKKRENHGYFKIWNINDDTVFCFIITVYFGTTISNCAYDPF